jgi:predicted rRNA methylase YqxC with S4 and FtsJ domains
VSATTRADVALVERGFFASRAKAREAIEAGLVTLDGRPVAKPSEPVPGNARLDARPAYPWVSRGGVKRDARTLSADDLPAPPQLIVGDVSFISLEKILPAVLALAAAQAEAVFLIKPQFEVGPERVKKGLVRDEAAQKAACDRIAALFETLGWKVIGLIPSPIEGGDGNREFLIGARRD